MEDLIVIGILIFFIIFGICMYFLTSRKQDNSKKTSINTRKLNIISNRKYDKNINSCYDKIIKNMSCSVKPESKDLRNMNKMEEIFIKEFLYQVQFIRKKYYISLIRYSKGELGVLYKHCPVGKVCLKNEKNIWMQVLIGLYKNKIFHDLTFDETLQNIRYWISYIKNHLKEERF